MIDIHTHVLPHIDDGAKDTATAIVMLQAEKAQGVTEVVLTSHFYGKKRAPAHFLEKRAAMFAHIQPQIPAGISVRLGTEVHFTGVNVAGFDELCTLAIEGTRYILIEFPFTDVWESSLLDKLSEFISETGYTPIIAHVERYKEVQKNPAIVNELIHMGCLIQVNTSSFLEGKERGLARALLSHNLVHCIGTDAHDPLYRAPNMLAAKSELEKLGFSETWERIQETMKTVLEGGQVRVEREKPVKKFLWKYL